MTSGLYLPSQVETSVGVSARVVMLPTGLRIAPNYTITAVTPVGVAANITLTAAALFGATSLTVTATTAAYAANTILQLGAGGPAVVLSAAAASGATSLTVFPLNFDLLSGSVLVYNPGALTVGTTMLAVSALPILVDVGDILQFGAQSVTVAGPSPAGATQLRVLATTAEIAANTTATTKGTLLFAGLEKASFPTPNLKVEDTTRQTSGTGKEGLLTQQAFEVPIDYQIIRGDRGGKIIYDICSVPALMTREVFMQVRSRTGDLHEMVCIPTQNQEQGGLQQKRMRQAKMEVQGENYTFTPSPYVFF